MKICTYYESFVFSIDICGITWYHQYISTLHTIVLPIQKGECIHISILKIISPSPVPSPDYTKCSNPIIIIDAIMGTGKSTFLIQEIINKNPDSRFLCVVPTIDKTNSKNELILGEVGRYMQEINAVTFQPETRPSKSKDLQRLIASDRNIVTSHALIQNIDETTMDLLRKSNYTLIIDECLDVIHEYKTRFRASDGISIFNDQYVTADSNGLLCWNYEKDKKLHQNHYQGRWDDIKRLCEQKALMCMIKQNGESSRHTIMWTLPPSFFSLFNATFIATYLWNGSMQKKYFDLFQIPYQHMSLIDGKLIPYSPEQERKLRSRYAELIDIYHGNLNTIGDSSKKDRYPLSKSWYQRKKREDPSYLLRLKNNTYNYFRNISQTKANENMFTVFKDFRKDVSSAGYAKGFVACNAKATNSFRHKKSLAYLIDYHPPTGLLQFFHSYGINVDPDQFALSELLQWIWRSGIRDMQPISLYIPSARMRILLENWLAGASFPA